MDSFKLDFFHFSGKQTFCWQIIFYSKVVYPLKWDERKTKQHSTASSPGGGSSEPLHVLHVQATNPHFLLQIPADCLTHIRSAAAGGVARLHSWFQ